ncbi:NADPH-dependent FMN reductase [Streptomyces sp. NPDC088812]|uniref:NADPH-dependent FMN reductase n=1 Tax=Streptomyces sp. NPDC088812 TaxID=3365905 RepID=UPI00380C4BF6
MLIVGIGGTTRPGSTSELAVATALAAAQRKGADTRHFGGTYLASLPHYTPENPARTAAQHELVETVRHADGLIIATPGYHGGISALVKNALDLLEDLRTDTSPYFTGRAVGCIVTAAGWQACGTTLTSLRSVVHAMRGWPTPLGVTLNTAATPPFGRDGACTGPAADRLTGLANQVLSFATCHASGPRDPATAPTA